MRGASSSAIQKRFAWAARGQESPGDHPSPHRRLVSGVAAMAPRTYWKGYLKLSLVSCSAQPFPAIGAGEDQISPNQQLDREPDKYCKLDAVSGKPINGAPPSITSERLQTGRARGPARRAESSIEMAETGTRCVSREPSARRDRLPGHQDRASLGDCDRCDLFRGRPGRHATIYLARCQRGICVMRVGAWMLCRRKPWSARPRTGGAPRWPRGRTRPPSPLRT
jgi:hypothetical protein